MLISPTVHADKLSTGEILNRIEDLKVDTSHCDKGYLDWLAYEIMQAPELKATQVSEFRKKLRQFKKDQCEPAGFYKKGHKNYIDPKKRISDKIDYLSIK